MVKKRGLGKSLDALLVGSGTDVAVMPDAESTLMGDALTMLSVESVQRGKYQPRRDMDLASLEELAASIRVQGVIQPIVVRRLAGKGTPYEIVAGERRWRAAQMAGLTEIPAIIRDIPDSSAVAIALIENIQRENLNPIEEAAALRRLLDEFSMTHQAVADAVGKSRTTVTNLLRLLALPERARMMLERGDIEMGHARALLTLPEELQLLAAEKCVQENLSVRETEELVRRLQLQTFSGEEGVELPSKKPLDPDIRRLQEELSARLHLRVAINCNAKGRGKLVIRYGSLAELDAILGYFQKS